MEEPKYTIDDYCRVEIEHPINAQSPYFGNRLFKHVLEEHSISEYDKRKKIAPCGVDMDVKMVHPEGGKMHIHILAGMFEYNEVDSETGDFDWFYYLFEIMGYVFQLSLKFNKEDNMPVDIELEHWWEDKYFEDGDDADDVYTYSEEDSGIHSVTYIYTLN